jgi:hypothetical protein
MAPAKMLPKAMTYARLMHSETPCSLSTSASTGSSVASDSEDISDSVIFNTLPFERPALMSIKNTFLEFYTEEEPLSPVCLRKVKSTPDMFVSSEIQAIQEASTASQNITASAVPGQERADSTCNTHQQGEQMVRDTFRKFGWPLSFGDVSERGPMHLVLSPPLPQRRPVVARWAGIAQIPPPPAAPPCLPATDHSYATGAVGALLVRSPCPRMLASVLKPSTWQHTTEEEQEESMLDQCSQSRSPKVQFKTELGSPELPTLGSVGHWQRKCKPCAFFHKKGCDNGVTCQFCHLCDAGEKACRQKVKYARLEARSRRMLRPEFSKRW